MSDNPWNDRDPVNDDEPMTITIGLSCLQPDERVKKRRTLVEAIAAKPLARHEELVDELHGANDQVFTTVRQFAEQHDLKVVRERRVPGEVVLTGTARQLRRHMGVDFKRVDGEGRRIVVPVALDNARMPEALANYVTAVMCDEEGPSDGLISAFLFDEVARARGSTHHEPKPASRPDGKPFTVLDLAALYNFPPNLDGSGVKVGFILPEGGLPEDVLGTYFDALSLKRPSIQLTELGLAKNSPAPLEEIREIVLAFGLGLGGPPLHGKEGTERTSAAPVRADRTSDPSKRNLFTMEILLDLAICGSVANGAEMRVYRTLANRVGLRDAVIRAADDGVSILVITWGAAERDGWENWGVPQGQVPGLNHALDYAIAKKGVTVLCASGDGGSTPSRFVHDRLEPTFPASHDLVVTCGGTAINGWTASGFQDEVVWNELVLGRQMASCGGFSRFVEQPPWQRGLAEIAGVAEAAGIAEPGRGVPDIAANAAFASGVWLWLGSANALSFGTSAAAPLLAGLMARIYQGLTSKHGISGIPGLGALLYDPAVRKAMRPILKGNNIRRNGVNRYDAGPGWNACTGLGRPSGIDLQAAIEAFITRP
ncbi:S53 family peptidase [Sorangium sp. So ce145]|uniref:S53 family peptidase n=1 Tax=Sorangium sp. So ce145 TaxID=3133285 RepID=UPI003F5FCE10